jgi:hypothetical protein
VATADENWREEAERDLRVKAFSRVDDKKELEKPTKDSRERIQGARENLTSTLEGKILLPSLVGFSLSEQTTRVADLYRVQSKKSFERSRKTWCKLHQMINHG